MLGSFCLNSFSVFLVRWTRASQLFLNALGAALKRICSNHSPMHVEHPLVPRLVGKHFLHKRAASRASCRVAYLGPLYSNSGSKGAGGGTTGALLAAFSLILLMKLLSLWEMLLSDWWIGGSPRRSLRSCSIHLGMQRIN